ncbi:glutamate receptor ionotropic, NMDA 3A-like [Panulirus ornatus]|uniref:glutamate receptor ionotropic, NMDA 3A-like n=1 Tax=Panulirus ornatus TaxID=150431 RepID=UPI003A862973
MRYLPVLLLCTLILLSYTTASVVGGRGGGRSRPGGLQDGLHRSAKSPLEGRLPADHPFPTILRDAPLKTDPGDSPSAAPLASTNAALTTARHFPTPRKDTSSTTSTHRIFPPTYETRPPSEDAHQAPSRENHQPPPFVTTAAAAPKNATPVYRLGAVFEPDHIQILSNVFFQSLKEQNRLIGGVYRLEGVVIETPALTGNALQGACETLKFEKVGVGLAVGVTQSIYASGTLASLAGVPLIARSLHGYRDDTLKTLLPDLIVANPRLSDLWEAATSFISALEWCQPILIHDDSPQALQLAHIVSRDDQYETMGLSLSANLPRHHFQNRLSGILHTVRRLIFVSGTVDFVQVVFSHGEDLDMFNGEYIWILLDIPLPGTLSESLRPGLLSLRPDFLRTPKKQLLVNFVKSSISVISEFFKETTTTSSALLSTSSPVPCRVPYRNLSTSQFEIHRQLKAKLASSRISQRSLPGLTPFFYVENLVPKKTGVGAQWTRVGFVNGSEVQINAIFWPGRGYKGVSEQNKRLRVALAEAPPFVMTSPLIENATCLLGVVCLRVFSAEVAATFADMEREVVNASRGYEVVCCSGLSVDLMINVATDLEIELQVYLVMDGTFGAPRSTGWTGIVGDLLDGSADLSFAPLSVTAQRARHLDFSDPYFFSSMSILSSTKQMEVPLLAFLVPFSPDLWIAIFVSLNITAFSVAVYEWLSPFGLNPWGRQRSKNFSYGSALWVIWGLLFSHLVAFKAPKSWPNKVLINVWGAFSVIFVASYTANIAALFAGLFQTRYLHGRNVGRAFPKTPEQKSLASKPFLSLLTLIDINVPQVSIWTRDNRIETPYVESGYLSNKWKLELLLFVLKKNNSDAQPDAGNGYFDHTYSPTNPLQTHRYSSIYPPSSLLTLCHQLTRRIARDKFKVLSVARGRVKTNSLHELLGHRRLSNSQQLVKQTITTQN